MIIDLYGGPGGWAEGLRLLGLDEVGVELDPWPCATRRAAGHRVVRADVARMPVDHLTDRVDGLIASPPCQAFSAAGNGEGRALIGALRLAIERGDWAAPGYPVDVRPVLEVGRWVEAVRPRWVACEQVPPALPLWASYGRRLRGHGYSTWAGILNAADYGVPQTRRRAILLASLDDTVGPPTPTHAQGGADTLFGALAPWVSMAEALGWGLPAEPSPIVMTARNRQTGHDALNGSAWRRDWFRRQQDAGNWVAQDLRGAGMTERHGPRPGRPLTEPAPTVRAGGGSSASPGFVFVLHTNRDQRPDGTRQTVESPQPAPALTAKAGGQWVFDRPATTIAGDSRCWPPGHKVNADDRRRQPDADERYGDRAGTEAIRLTITDALILQSFDPTYPVRGTKTEQFRQIGNAVPPLLAAHVLAGVTGRTLGAAA